MDGRIIYQPSTFRVLGDVFAPEVRLSPSEYFNRQCYACTDTDEVPVKYVLDYMGNSRLVFSTDFPHSDSRFPKAVETFLELPIPDEDKRKILWGNCTGYYGIT